jgi:hypothetical protein
MMMHRKIAILLAAAFVGAAPTAAAAQQAFGPALDVSAGVFAGGGGTFAIRGGPAADAVLALPLGRTSAGTMVAGLTGGISGVVPGGDLECINGPDDKCLPDYPTFTTLGAVAGIQRGFGSGLSARALAGPAYYRAEDGPDVFGLQGRLDVAKPLALRVSLVGSLRGAVLPGYQDETLSFAAFGLGLRIQ